MTSLALKYGFFALIATVFNIGTQKISSLIFGDIAFLNQSLFAPFEKIEFLSIVEISIGTGIGFVVKYILDKKWIFYAKAPSIAEEGKTFFLYMIMALVTTGIFWGFEFMGELAFSSDNSKYITGSFGLLIGYTIKYFLDKRFVFTSLEQVDVREDKRPAHQQQSLHPQEEESKRQ